MPDDWWSNGRHCKNYCAGWWKFLYYCKCTWALETGWCFQPHPCEPGSPQLWSQSHSDPDAAWLMRFPVLSVGAETAPRCVASGIIVSNPFDGFQMSLELFFSFLDMLVLCWKLRETADLQRLPRCICSCNPIGVVFLQNLPFADSQSQSWLREDTGLCRGSVLQCYGLIVGLGNCFSSF